MPAGKEEDRPPPERREDRRIGSVRRRRAGLIEAVVSINGADVVHGDVKPDNVLLTSPEKGSPGGARVLMVDLGGAGTNR